jgi:hypothetical protein
VRARRLALIFCLRANNHPSLGAGCEVTIPVWVKAVLSTQSRTVSDNLVAIGRALLLPT